MLTVFILIISCKSKNTVVIDVQGHRGCRGLMPENSIPAFKKALDLGVNTLEMDVVISKDRKVIVSHEPYMSHEIALGVNGYKISKEDERSYNLYHMTYDSIQRFDCGSKQHPRFPHQKKIKTHKPLLLEVIRISEEISNNNIHYNIEIKSNPAYDRTYTPEVSEFVSLVLEVIKSESISNRVILQSFDLRALEEIRKQNPQIQIALLVDENERISEKISNLSFKPEIISPYFKLLNLQKVKRYQTDGIKVIPWTVNKENDLALMLSFNVDGVITDYPNLLLREIND